jgi:hypothetical protein
MNLLLAVLLIGGALAFAFWLAGYGTGKIKRHFLSISLVVIISSLPAIWLFRVRVFIPMVIAAALWFSLFPVAGHVMARKPSPFWVSCARAAVCVLVLIGFTRIVVWWVDETHWLDARRWHHANSNGAQIGSWQFSIPDAWYPTHGMDRFSRQLGAREALDLQRASLSAGSRSASIYIATPAPPFLRRALEDEGLVEDKRFQVQGEYGQCSYSESEKREPPFRQTCLFSRADLYIEIEVHTQDELLEAARIISGARFLKTSDPDAVRQHS